MADFEIVIEGVRKEGEVYASQQLKPEIKVEFHQSVTAGVPHGHILRKENLFLCPLTPSMKTVEHVVDRLKKDLNISGNIYMKTMDGVVLMPEYPAEKLPSYGKLQMLHHDDSSRGPDTYYLHIVQNGNETASTLNAIL